MSAEMDAVTETLTEAPTKTMMAFTRGDVRAEVVVREVVRRKRAGSKMSLPDEAAVAMVVDGLRQASRCAGVSERTLRRQVVRDGSTIKAFVTQARLQAARELYALGWRTDRSAAALGYSNAAAFCRFLRRSSGEGVWSLRKASRSPRAR